MSLYETRMCICCVLMLLIPISIVSTSYSLVLLTVHRMHSAEGRRKGFTTRSSHLTVVSIFCGAAFCTHVLPPSFHTPEQDEERKGNHGSPLVVLLKPSIGSSQHFLILSLFFNGEK
ncbi:hypothetical protein H8958_021253 [Nasalis larvatus]